MKLHPPFIITPRLEAGLCIGEAFVSMRIAGTEAGRAVYAYSIDLPDGQSLESSDLRSGVGGGTLQEGFSSLLCFLGACAEGLKYEQRTGAESEGRALFPAFIAQWAADNEDEISLMASEIDEASLIHN